MNCFWDRSNWRGRDTTRKSLGDVVWLSTTYKSRTVAGRSRYLIVRFMSNIFRGLPTPTRGDVVCVWRTHESNPIVNWQITVRDIGSEASSYYVSSLYVLFLFFFHVFAEIVWLLKSNYVVEIVTLTTRTPPTTANVVPFQRSIRQLCFYASTINYYSFRHSTVGTRPWTGRNQTGIFLPPWNFENIIFK